MKNIYSKLVIVMAAVMIFLSIPGAAFAATVIDGNDMYHRSIKLTYDVTITKPDGTQIHYTPSRSSSSSASEYENLENASDMFQSAREFLQQKVDDRIAKQNADDGLQYILVKSVAGNMTLDKQDKLESYVLTDQFEYATYQLTVPEVDPPLSPAVAIYEVQVPANSHFDLNTLELCDTYGEWKSDSSNKYKVAEITGHYADFSNAGVYCIDNKTYNDNNDLTAIITYVITVTEPKTEPDTEKNEEPQEEPHALTAYTAVFKYYANYKFADGTVARKNGSFSETTSDATKINAIMNGLSKKAENAVADHLKNYSENGHKFAKSTSSMVEANKDNTTTEEWTVTYTEEKEEGKPDVQAPKDDPKDESKENPKGESKEGKPKTSETEKSSAGNPGSATAATTIIAYTAKMNYEVNFQFANGSTAKATGSFSETGSGDDILKTLKKNVKTKAEKAINEKIAEYKGLKLEKVQDDITEKSEKFSVTSTWKVTLKEQAGVAKETKSKANLKATKVKSVKAGKKALTVKWKKVKGATGYQVRYSLKSNMKKAKTITVKKASKTSLKIKKLKSKKKYYVQVRTMKKQGKTKLYSDWSKPVSKKTK